MCNYQDSRAGSSPRTSTLSTRPVVSSSAMASPVAGAMSIPQQPCPAATYKPDTPGTAPTMGVLSGDVGSKHACSATTVAAARLLDSTDTACCNEAHAPGPSNECMSMPTTIGTISRCHVSRIIGRRRGLLHHPTHIHLSRWSWIDLWFMHPTLAVFVLQKHGMRGDAVVGLHHHAVRLEPLDEAQLRAWVRGARQGLLQPASRMRCPWAHGKHHRIGVNDAVAVHNDALHRRVVGWCKLQAHTSAREHVHATCPGCIPQCVGQLGWVHLE